jgi:hypothetical protein
MGVGILPPSLGFKDFHHTARSQPPAGGHPQGWLPTLWWREASRAAASPLPSASRMFIIRAGEEGELSQGFAFRAGWRPAPSSNIRGRRAFASLAKEAIFGYAGSAV